MAKCGVRFQYYNTRHRPPHGARWRVEEGGDGYPALRRRSRSVLYGATHSHAHKGHCDPTFSRDFSTPIFLSTPVDVFNPSVTMGDSSPICLRHTEEQKVTCKIKVAVLQNWGTATFLSGLCVFVLFDYLTSFGDSFGDMIVNVVFAYNLVDTGIDECGVNIGIYTRQDDVDALFA